MAYQFQPGKLYRMPTHFGPCLGPRQGEGGRKFDNRESPKTTTLTVRFLTNSNQLEHFLPEGFELHGEPVVTVFASYFKEIEWLAGRGYNVLGVTIPTVYRGKQETVQGNFLLVLWENLADPIITGREDLGYAKVYCELPELVRTDENACTVASWLGFKFLDLEVSHLAELSPDEIASFENSQTGDGVLHYKYIPRTGNWGEADVAYAVLTPAATPNQVITRRWLGDGKVNFTRARWEDLPTLVHITNALEALEVKEYRGGSLMETVGGKDLSDQRMLG